VQVFVDDRLVEDDFAPAGTLEDALRHVQSQRCRPSTMVVGLRCNGEAIVGDALASALRQPASSYDRLEVFTGTREQLVADAMAQASTSLDETETASRRVAEFLIEGKIADATQTLGDCLRVWQQIHEAVGKSLQLLALDAERILIQDEPLIHAIGRPKDVLLQIKHALQAQDYVLLADVLQYEFADVIDTWHRIVARLRQEADDIHAAAGGAT